MATSKTILESVDVKGGSLTVYGHSTHNQKFSLSADVGEVSFGIWLTRQELIELQKAVAKTLEESE